MNLKSEFLRILTERGFIHQCTDLEGLDELLAREKITTYIGFDCTAPSLHVGSLMQIMVLRWLQKCGHKPIVLMGGATTKIGDPTGKDSARPPLSDETIATNMHGIQKNFEPFIDFADEHDYAKVNSAIMANNDDWVKNLHLITLLRDIGPHFSINRMLTMDSVKLRLEREQEMSLLEFNYMIIQAYDFVELNKKYNCRLQIGGSDQWGNIIGGVELHRRLMAKKNQGKINVYDSIFGLTTPLITTATGAKMGKTAAGAVWLDAKQCSPFDYWQFWRNTEDADVGRFLRFFTELTIAEIENLEKLEGAGINEAKKILATEATKLCHGEAAALEAQETARKTFELGGAGDSLPEFTIDAAMNPTIRTLLMLTKFVESGGEAKKLIEGGGVKINDEKVSDINLVVTKAMLNAEGYIKLSKGKKHHAIVRIK